MKPLAGAALLVALGAAVAPTVSCTTGGTTTSPSGATSAPTATGTPADCPGTYEVDAMTGKGSVDLEGGQTVTFDGDVSDLTLVLEESTWSLTGDQANAAVKVAEVAEVDATIDGSAAGTYEPAGSGDEYRFELAETSGTASVAVGDAGAIELDLADIAEAFAPVGQASLTCTTDSAVLDAESVTLQLRRVEGTKPSPTSTTGTATGTTTGTTTGAAAGTSPPKAGTTAAGPAERLTGSAAIAESNLTKTYDCAAATQVSINGSGSRLTFTGDCAIVAVNGDDNVVTFTNVGSLTLNGSRNAVSYSGAGPTVVDNGTANTITKS